MSVSQLRDQDQIKFSADGEPLHGIVGWDDIYMKPTQQEEDGTRSIAADDDTVMKCMFEKYADKGLLTKADALGATQELVSQWKHLNARQTTAWLKENDRFEKAFEHYDILKNDKVAFNEMYGLVKMVWNSK